MTTEHRATRRNVQNTAKWAILAAGLTMIILAILVALIQVMGEEAKAKIVAETEARMEHEEAAPKAETASTSDKQKNQEIAAKSSDEAANDEAKTEEVEAQQAAEAEEFYWDGPVINAVNGTVEGPGGTETYYNLPMGGVIEIMQSAGIYADYWVRDDGCKMYGDYIMIAADQSIPGRELGAILPTSRGLGMVCDTGTFIYNNPYQIDIAVE